jgi:hypothetical protein
MGREQSYDFLTIRNAWMEGKAPMPNDLVSIFETNFNSLLGLLLRRETGVPISPERCAAQPVTIVNKLSGKALEVDNPSIGQAARIHQITRNDTLNQRWFTKRANFSVHMAIPAAIFREVHRYWPVFFGFRFPATPLSRLIAGYVWIS